MARIAGIDLPREKRVEIGLRKEARCDFPCEHIGLFQYIFRSGNTV